MLSSTLTFTSSFIQTTIPSSRATTTLLQYSGSTDIKSSYKSAVSTFLNATSGYSSGKISFYESTVSLSLNSNFGYLSTGSVYVTSIAVGSADIVSLPDSSKTCSEYSINNSKLLEINADMRTTTRGCSPSNVVTQTASFSTTTYNTEFSVGAVTVF